MMRNGGLLLLLLLPHLPSVAAQAQDRSSATADPGAGFGSITLGQSTLGGTQTIDTSTGVRRPTPSTQDGAAPIEGVFRVGRTGIYCLKKPCPWRGITKIRE